MKNFEALNLESSKVDLSYLQQCGNTDLYQIKTCFDHSNFKEGQFFSAKISFVYDPSKFWMVTKFRELAAFKMCLFKFYYLNGSKYQVPASKIKPNIYAVAFSDQAYYRCIVRQIVSSIQTPTPRVHVYYIDYGMLGTVDMTDVYYVSESFMKVPQFAIRACLANVCPTSSDRCWTSSDASTFGNLCKDEVISGHIVHIDAPSKTLFVQFCIFDEDNVQTILHEELIARKIAQHSYNMHEGEDEDDTTDMVYIDEASNLRVRCAYLLPTHKMLESGTVPNSVDNIEHQAIISFGGYANHHHLCPKK